MFEVNSNELAFKTPTVHEGRANLNELHAMFVQLVSHELRTPVSIIQGYVELLNEGQFGDLTFDQQASVSTVVEHVRRLRDIVELTSLLIEVEAYTAPLAPVSLDEVVLETTNARRAAAEESGLMFEVNIDPDLPQVQGVTQHLGQALDCLLDNAIKFTPPGGSIEVYAYHSVTGEICVTVADCGVGIEETVLSRIFDRFYQPDSSSKRRYDGLGLGLAVVKAVIDAHDGQVEVISEPEHGSWFTIKLPAFAPQDSLSPHEARTDRSDSTSPQHILIVNDRKNIAGALRQSLVNFPNCEVMIVTGGVEALMLLQQQNFDLLITDYQMPGIDNVALVKYVRQNYPQTTVVTLTDADEAQLVSCNPLRRVLRKPDDLPAHRIPAILPRYLKISRPQ